MEAHPNGYCHLKKNQEKQFVFLGFLNFDIAFLA
jgi:hypothetical protein